MSPRVFSPLVEVFLLVEQPRQRLSHWTQALAPLDASTAPPVATVDAYFDPTTNVAIFGLRYDELALGPDRLHYVTEVAVLAEVAMIQPAELSEGDRRRFLGDRLSQCTEHVGDQRKVVSALVELVRRVRGHRTTTPPQKGTFEVTPITLPRASSGLRGPLREDDPPLVARGTRNGSVPESAATPRSAVLPSGTRDLARGSVRQPKLDAVDEAVAAARAAADKAKRLAQGSEPPEPPAWPEPVEVHDTEPSPRPGANLVARGGVHRANTIMMSPLETQRMLEAARVSTPEPEPEPAPPPRTRTRASSPQEAPESALSSEPGAIYARYLRGGKWIPIRIGALSLKGATLAGALPRLDDRVDVALTYGSLRALVRGSVAKVSTELEAVASGATTFSVRFELDDGARRQLTALLTSARAANLTLKPPPSRSTRRFPVEWPVAFGTMRGAVRAEALDVSADGMFVRPLNPLALDTKVTFTSVLDDGLSPVSGHARVVRNISDVDARSTGLSPGYGLSILEMNDFDRERWAAFLARIEQRTSRRVVIGAFPDRLTELRNGLVAAGYAATGDSDPSAIAQLAEAGARPVDAALIDAGWLVAAGSPAWVEEVFTARKVPCITMHGDARRARIAIDRLLAVA